MSGSVAVVTGASKNIGAAIATKLAQDGFKVAINYHSPKSEVLVDKLIREIKSNGGEARGYKFDVSDEEDVSENIAKITKELGLTQVMINNAAESVASSMTYDQVTISEWDSVMATNLRGMFICSKKVIPAMMEIGEGSIVNISSVRFMLGTKGNIHYTTTKAGQVGFSRVLAREVGNSNIRVNSIVVGGIKTPEESIYGDEDSIDAWMLDVQAIQRRGIPQDVANVVSFFAGPLSTFITGQSLVVDGGWVMD